MGGLHNNNFVVGMLLARDLPQQQRLLSSMRLRRLPVGDSLHMQFSVDVGSPSAGEHGDSGRDPAAPDSQASSLPVAHAQSGHSETGEPEVGVSTVIELTFPVRVVALDVELTGGTQEAWRWRLHDVHPEALADEPAPVHVATSGRNSVELRFRKGWREAKVTASATAGPEAAWRFHLKNGTAEQD